MKADYLKPCPFCGGGCVMHRGVVQGLMMIRCAACEATVSFGGREEPQETIDAWNERVGDTV